MSKPVALTIAGADPTGGAGIQADLKTFGAHNVYGVSAISVLTAQNDSRFEVFPVSGDFIGAQIEAIFEQFRVDAIKIGMLGDKVAVGAVVEALRRFNADGAIPVVLDPVIRASNDGVALNEAGLRLLRDDLLPLTTLIKPNLHEAALLLDEREATNIAQMRQQAVALARLGPSAVLLSGGHLAGPEAVDILSIGEKISAFSVKKLEIPARHGTGCALTSAIAANLAKGLSLFEAIDLARTWLAGLMAQEPVNDRAQTGRCMDHLAASPGTRVK